MSNPPSEGGSPYITGSAMIAHATTKEEVLEAIQRDVYAHGIWNMDKVCSLPLVISLVYGAC